MSKYRKSAHCVDQLHFHFVFTPKYRKPVLVGRIGNEVRQMIREICKSEDVEILAGHVRPDHVHLFVSVPPKVAPSKLMQAVKGKTSHRMLSNNKFLQKGVVGFTATANWLQKEVRELTPFSRRVDISCVHKEYRDPWDGEQRSIAAKGVEPG